MKKVIMGAVLGLMSVVAFAQGTAPNQGQQKPQHTREEAQVAKEACKKQVGQPAGNHEAVKECMMSKGFKPHPVGEPRPASNPAGSPAGQKPAVTK